MVRGLRGISDRLCQTLWSHGLYLDWPHQVQRSHRMIQNHPSRPLLLKFSWSYSYLRIPHIFYGVLSNTLVKGLLFVGKKKPPTYWIASYTDYDSISFFPLSGSSVCLSTFWFSSPIPSHSSFSHCLISSFLSNEQFERFPSHFIFSSDQVRKRQRTDTHTIKMASGRKP